MEEMNLSLLVAKNNIALSVNTSLTYAQLGVGNIHSFTWTIRKHISSTW